MKCKTLIIILVLLGFCLLPFQEADAGRSVTFEIYHTYEDQWRLSWNTSWVLLDTPVIIDIEEGTETITNSLQVAWDVTGSMGSLESTLSMYAVDTFDGTSLLASDQTSYTYNILDPTMYGGSAASQGSDGLVLTAYAEDSGDDDGFSGSVALTGFDVTVGGEYSSWEGEAGYNGAGGNTSTRWLIEATPDVYSASNPVATFTASDSGADGEEEEEEEEAVPELPPGAIPMMSLLFGGGFGWIKMRLRK